MLSNLRKLPVIRRVFNMLTGGTSETQDGLDMYNLAVLFKSYEWHQNNDNSKVQTSPASNVLRAYYPRVFGAQDKIQPAQVQTIEDSLQQYNHFDDMDYVHNAATVQLRKMFGALAQQEQQHPKPLTSLVGFELELRPSSIPGAGLGVFIKDVVNQQGQGQGEKEKEGGDRLNVISPGTVVALFPGLVHLNEPIPYLRRPPQSSSIRKSAASGDRESDSGKGELVSKDMYIQEELLPDPQYMLLMRLDGIFIDSRTCNQLNQHGSDRGGSGGGDEPLVVERNPYALAHYVNHPPPDTAAAATPAGARPVSAQPPNVIQLRYDFMKPPIAEPEPPMHSDSAAAAVSTGKDRTWLPSSLLQFVPNRYASPPQLPRLFNRNIAMHSSLLVACRYLAPGDELFVDYRLGPDLPSELIPAWYAHVDSDGARSRLGGTARVDSAAAVHADEAEAAAGARTTVAEEGQQAGDGICDGSKQPGAGGSAATPAAASTGTGAAASTGAAPARPKLKVAR